MTFLDELKEYGALYSEAVTEAEKLTVLQERSAFLLKHGADCASCRQGPLIAYRFSVGLLCRRCAIKLGYMK